MVHRSTDFVSRSARNKYSIPDSINNAFKSDRTFREDDTEAATYAASVFKVFGISLLYVTWDEYNVLIASP